METKKNILLFLFLFSISSFSFAQCTDSTRQADKYHIIDTDFLPVCGCDGKTYRNTSAAYWWGGINQWSDGPCEAFDIDLYPNLLYSGFSSPGHLRIYMRSPGNATLVIYNAFGKLMLQKIFSSSLANTFIADANPFELYDVQNFPTGVYQLIVTVAGQKKIRKFIKVSP